MILILLYIFYCNLAYGSEQHSAVVKKLCHIVLSILSLTLVCYVSFSS